MGLRGMECFARQISRHLQEALRMVRDTGFMFFSLEDLIAAWVEWFLFSC